MIKPKISVIGLGFVGLTLAVVNAAKGFHTIGIDNDVKKLKNLAQGKPNFFEANIDSYLKKSKKNSKLFLGNDLSEIKKTDITFLTVGTPSQSNGEIDLSQLKQVCAKLKKILKNKKNSHLIVIKSTIIPTTTLKIIYPYFKNMKQVNLVVNPEFLREGRAIRDLLEPYLIVIGCNQKTNCDKLEKYYKIFYNKVPEIIKTDFTSAEMVKYTNNAFLATKISFINSIANMCKNLPMVDVKTIAFAIGKDSRIGSEFLHAGPGFGGSCLPKDLSAIIQFSNKIGDGNTLLKAVQEINQLQKNQIINTLKKWKLYNKNKVISILGLAFKRDTDDIRESISIKLIQNLLKNKIKIKVHDPMAIENTRKIFGKKIQYSSSISECITNSDCCVILTDWNDYKKLQPSTFKTYMKKPSIIDAKRILDHTKFNKMRFDGIGLGE